jgi:hypothetical protein
MMRVLLGAVGVCLAYLALLAYPQPLFAHSVQRGNIVLHARQPLPPEGAQLLEDVLSRVARSPLYEADRVHHVFLCDTPALYGLFALWNRGSGAIANYWVEGNVFIRPSSVKRNRVIGASGVEKAGDRTLAYYMAHEVAHAMTADAVGRLHYSRLAVFQVEGYADYVAFARPVDVEQGRRSLLAGERDMDPQLSGHYDRYRLLVGYLLQNRGMSVTEVLSRPLELDQIEKQLVKQERESAPRK